MSAVIIVAGERGQGKSTFVKNRVRNLPRDRLHAYDLQREYFPNEPLPEIGTFTEEVKTKRNCFIIFEEATIFFPNRGYDKNVVYLLVSARHAGNVVYLVYHSISAVPEYIYNLANYMVLFKTKDRRHKVEEKYEELVDGWEIVNHGASKRNLGGKALELQLPNGKISNYVIINL